MCQRRPEGHLWYSDTFVVPPVKLLSLDWCVTCGERRAEGEAGDPEETTK